MDFLEAVQVRALYSVLEPDHDAFIRHVFRFYSKKFNVPLPEVPDLPLEDVFLAYYEEAFESMDDETRQEFLDRLTENEEERAQRLESEAKQETADDEFYKKLNEEVAAGTKKELPKERKLIRPSDKPPASAKDIRDAIRQGALGGQPTATASEPKPPLFPDIHMDFGSNLLEEMGDQDPLAPPPKKVK